MTGRSVRLVVVGAHGDLEAFEAFDQAVDGGAEFLDLRLQVGDRIRAPAFRVLAVAALALTRLAVGPFTVAALALARLAVGPFTVAALALARLAVGPFAVAALAQPLDLMFEFLGGAAGAGAQFLSLVGHAGGLQVFGRLLQVGDALLLGPEPLRGLGAGFLGEQGAAAQREGQQDDRRFHGGAVSAGKAAMASR